MVMMGRLKGVSMKRICNIRKIEKRVTDIADGNAKMDKMPKIKNTEKKLHDIYTGNFTYKRLKGRY